MSANPTTLQTILTMVRNRTNMENSQFVTDAELTTYINNSLCQLDMILVSKYNDYKLANVTGQVPNSSAQITLPSDFLKLRGVDVQWIPGNADGFISLMQFSFQHRNKKLYPVGGNLGYGPYQLEYRLQGNTIQLLPVAVATQWTFRIWYTPDYVPLVNSTDTLQTYMDSQNWYEYAVVDTAIKVLQKQDLDPGSFMAQKAELKEMIIKLSAPAREKGAPASVVDSRFWDSYPGGYGYGW